jgi:hypothetical protein
MNEPVETESWFRRHRTAIIITLVAVASAVVVGRVLSNNRAKGNAAEAILLEGMRNATNNNRYPFGSPTIPKIDNHYRVPVREIGTNTTWISETEAARYFKVPQGSISKNANGLLSSVGDLNFELAEPSA